MQLSFILATKLAELLRSAEKQGYKCVKVHSDNLLAVGADPLNPTHLIDLTSEQIYPISNTPLTSEALPFEAAGSISLSKLLDHASELEKRATRRTGNYWIEVKGLRIPCASLKELLAEGLKRIEELHPGTLDRLSDIKPRSKRIVSRDREKLFAKQELVVHYAEKLTDGWWFGTNNSRGETLTWLRRAADIAGLEWGKTVRTNVG